MDWSWDGDETDEESKIRAEAQKILELPELPISATTVRVPVLVGHAEAVWVALDDALTAAQATEILSSAPSVRVVDVPTPGDAAKTDQVLVGRVRPDRAGENGLVLFLACDNLVKGAALNAFRSPSSTFARRQCGLGRAAAPAPERTPHARRAARLRFETRDRPAELSRAS
jgi:aspartate-semialdehyde dehydrogenase